MSRPGDGMRPINFPHANLTLGPPAGMEDCEPLRVERTERSFVSWWRPDELDRAALARDGVVRLEVFGDGHPPVAVGVALPPAEVRPAAPQDIGERIAGRYEDALRNEIADLESERDDIREALRLRTELHEASERMVAALGARVAELEEQLDRVAHPVFRDIGGIFKDESAP